MIIAIIQHNVVVHHTARKKGTLISEHANPNLLTASLVQRACRRMDQVMNVNLVTATNTRSQLTVALLQLLMKQI